MSIKKNEYPIIGFQWELLALIVGMWGREKFGVDLTKQLTPEEIESVLDEDFCRMVARRFRQHWIKPTIVDPNRQERVARLLVEIDEMVEEMFRETDELHRELQRRCAMAGCYLEEPGTSEPPASAMG